MSASRDDTIATAKGELEIYAIHHASLMLTWNDKCVLVDPAPLPGGADPMADFKSLPKSDLIVFTHSHFDHFDMGVLQAVAGPATEIVAPQEVFDLMPKELQVRTKVLKNGEHATVSGIPMQALPMYNVTPERMGFHPKGVGNGYILVFGGKRIYVAGDAEETPELAHLTDIDVAFLPMNLPYTQTVEAAAHWVKDFRPAVVYPYHFGNPDGTFSDLNAFKAEVGNASEVRVLKWY